MHRAVGGISRLKITDKRKVGRLSPSHHRGEPSGEDAPCMCLRVVSHRLALLSTYVRRLNKAAWKRAPRRTRDTMRNMKRLNAVILPPAHQCAGVPSRSFGSINEPNTATQSVRAIFPPKQLNSSARRYEAGRTAPREYVVPDFGPRPHTSNLRGEVAP